MITNWEITKEDYDLLVLVAVRAKAELTGYPDDRRTLIMDLNACHANGCALDFKGLLAAPLGDFSHDIYGIRKAINRDTGKLTEDVFMPRYAAANHVPLEDPACACGHSRSKHHTTQGQRYGGCVEGVNGCDCSRFRLTTETP
jgi:hypothetical protein